MKSKKKLLNSFLRKGLSYTKQAERDIPDLMRNKIQFKHPPTSALKTFDALPDIWKPGLNVIFPSDR